MVLHLERHTARVLLIEVPIAGIVDVSGRIIPEYARRLRTYQYTSAHAVVSSSLPGDATGKNPLIIGMSTFVVTGERVRERVRVRVEVEVRGVA